MSLGVSRICRLRRLGPGVHAGSSSRGQSFRYHLRPAPKKRRVSQWEGEDSVGLQGRPSPPCRAAPAPYGPEDFLLVTSACSHHPLPLGCGQDPHRVPENNSKLSKDPTSAPRTGQKPGPTGMAQAGFLHKLQFVQGNRVEEQVHRLSPLF